MNGSLLTAVLACSLVASGCATTRAPVVDVANATLGEVSDQAYVVNFDLNLSNPNPEPLQLYQIEYRLSVDGVPMYSGRRSAEATIKAEGDSVLTIPAVVRHDQAGSDRLPSQVHYDLSGTLWYVTQDTFADILFDAGVRRPSVVFGTEGSLTFADE